MTRLVRKIAVLLTFALCLMTAASGFAQAPANNKQRARELYTKGQQLFRQGNYADAQRHFEDAYTAVPNPIVLLSISECQVRAEQYPQAIATLKRYLEERKDAPDRAQVEAQIGKLEQKPAVLTVESSPAGAIVLVDGADTGKLTPTELEVPPGEHRIAVQIEGFQRAEQAVTLAPGARDAVRLSLPEVAPAPVAAPPVAAAPAEPPEKSSLTPVWVATGVAGAGLLTGAICGGLALKTRGDFDDKPTEKKADRGERLALFSDVGFGVAIAGGVTALILYFTRDDAAPEASGTDVSVAPTASRTEVGLSGTLRF